MNKEMGHCRTPFLHSQRRTSSLRIADGPLEAARIATARRRVTRSCERCNEHLIAYYATTLFRKDLPAKI